MKKHILGFVFILSLLSSSISALAKSQVDHEKYIEPLENGYYYETTIVDESDDGLEFFATTKYITKTKTTKLKNSSGDVMWSVSIKATFSYNGSTSKCTSCTPSATAYGSAWSIKSVTSSKSGNSATATAKAAYTSSTGASQTYTKSVTIKCSASGVVS